MKINQKKIIKITGVVIIIAMLVLVYFFAIPAFVNIKKYKPEINEYLTQNLLVPLDTGNLDIDMTWDLGVKIKTDKALLKKTDGSKFVSIESSYAKFSLIPLLFKNVEIREVVINNPDANITRLSDGTFDIAKILVKKERGKYRVKFKDTSILLNNYRLNFTDKFIKPNKELLTKGNNLKITGFTPNKHIEIDSTGLIYINDNPEIPYNLSFATNLPFNTKHWTKNCLKLKGNIKNFNLEELQPYLNKYSPRQFSTFTGKGNSYFDIGLNSELPGRRRFFINSTIKGLNIEDTLKGSILSHKDDLNFLTYGNFDDNDLYLENFQVNGEKLNTIIQGKISNFANKKIRNVDLRINIANTGIKTSAEIFPKFVKVPLDPFRKILKHNIDGTISGIVNAKGYYKRPELYGKVKYNDFSIINKNEGTPNSSGTLDFVGTKLEINSKQYFDKNEFVETTGNVIPFKGKTLNLNINSTQNLDIEKSIPALLVIRDIFRFKLKPVTEMTMTGKSKISLNIQGGFKTPKITGYVDVKNATAKYITLASKAENVNGRVKFTGDKIYYDELIGFVDGIKLIPSGYSTLKAYSDVKLYMPELDLKKGQKFIYGSPLLKEVQVALKDVEDIKGNADTTIYLKGTDKNLDSRGVLKFTNGYLKYKGYGEPFNKLKGQLRYINDGIFFDNINGNVLTSNVSVKGSVIGKTKELDMIIYSDKLNLEEAKKFVINSTLLYKTHKIVNDYTFVKGNAKTKLVLKGNAEKDPLQSLVFSNINADFINKQVGFPVNISKGSLNITTDSVETPGLQGNSGVTDYSVKGKVSNLVANIKNNAPLIPNLELKINRFNAYNFNDVLKSPVFPGKIKKNLSKFSNVEGFADIYMLLKPSGFNATIDFDNLKIIYKPYELPITIGNGRAEITDKKISFYDLKGMVSYSDFYLKGSVKNYLKNPNFEILYSLDFNADDAAQLSSIFKMPIIAKGIVPLSAKIKGTTDNWKIRAKMTFNKGSYLRYTKEIGLPDDKVRMLSLDAEGKKDKLNIKSFKLDLFGGEYDLTGQSPWKFDFDENKDNILEITGSIDKITSGNPLFKNFKISTNRENPLSTCILNPCLTNIINSGSEKFFSEGDIKADLTINGPVLNPDIQGAISVSGLKAPDIKLNIDNASISFKKDGINVDLNNFKIDDSSVNIHALLDYSFELPLIVKEMEITSDYVNVDRISKIFVANKNLVNTGIGEIKIPYIVIQNGKLSSKELIMRDLITYGVRADFNFTPDWLLSVSNLQINAAGGTGTGNIDYNLKSTELSLNLNVKDMQANALTTTLTNLPNEVYGTLSGEGQFYTKGRNIEEMISNSNGYASFKVNDGHLVRLGSMEYFLRAVNVVQSGIGGLNFNNILDLIAPQKTGYFDYLEGKVDIKDGVLSTEDITSSGQNLSLFISGNLDMLTSYANVKVLGKLSKKVSGMLGPLGSTSINQFIGYIPGFGFLPSTPDEKGLIDLIPGLSKIPVLGLDGKEKYRQFAVDIDGNLYDQKSVKSFRWLD